MQQRYAFLATQLAIFRQPVVILDLEATGGNVQSDRITEIAFLRFDGDKVQAFSQLVNPETDILPFITALTGISNDMVADAPSFAQLLPDILPLLRGAVLLAHHARFDYRLLCHECERAGVPFSGSSLCTVKLSKSLYPNESKHNLDAIAERFQLYIDGERHRALVDVMVLADFLQAAFLENAAVWQKAFTNLLSPPLLSPNLPHAIREQVATLHDGYGVVAIERESGREWLRCEQVYQEVVAWLNRLPAHQWHTIRAISCRATVGELHNMAVYAEWLRECGETVGRESGFHTALVYEHSGCLKMKIRPLTNGFYAEPPTGLFFHPKAGKRALLEWAKAHGICVTRLGALPYSLPKSAACPVALTEGCVCEHHDLIEHNARVTQRAVQLPIVDSWGYQRAVIREHNPVSGETQACVVERGALLLSDGTWFVHENLLDILKRKWKYARKSVKWV